MTTQNIAIGVLVALTLLFGVLYLAKKAVTLDLGATATGPTHYQTESFLQGLHAGSVAATRLEIENTGKVIFGGGMIFSSTFATSSGGSSTYTAASLTDISTVMHNVTGTLTATLPASTTLSAFVPATGDMRRIVVVNTGTATLTLAGGAGTLLKTASSTKAVLSGGAAVLDFIRRSDTDIAVFMSTAI